MLKKKYSLGRAIGEGIIFLLPVLILIVIYKWLYGFIFSFAKPLSLLFFMKTEFPYIILTIVIMIAICYVVGVSVKTKPGRFILSRINRILSMLPGYAFLLGITVRIFRGGASRFSSVVLVDLFNNGNLVTGFITDENEKHSMKTIFVPTGPNPTSGMIYHIKSKNIYHVDVPIEDAMRSIISCGNGSKKLIEELKGKIKK